MGASAVLIRDVALKAMAKLSQKAKVALSQISTCKLSSAIKEQSLISKRKRKRKS